MTDATLARIDRLYTLLPVVYRQRDSVQGFPLRDLLRIIAEQVNLIEDDISQMYDDWFIETCRDWVVPYIADLVGYQPVHLAGDPDESPGRESRLRDRAITPRADVAHFIRDLRRRGTLALLEELASDSAGFPARAVEFFTLLGKTQSINHLDGRGRFTDLREGEALDLIDSPFDQLAHTVDIRNVTATRNPGRYNVPNAGEFLWRLRSYGVTHAPAYYVQRGFGYFFYTFSVLGNDAPLFARARREPDPTMIAQEVNLPVPIRRRALELHPDDYYGPSFLIWLDGSDTPVDRSDIIAADLTGWTYRPPDGKVAVDPQLGRIALAKEAKALDVTYCYGFSGDVGAHESPRSLVQPRDAVIYRVGPDEEFTTIAGALTAWRTEAPLHAVVEIADSRTYTEAVDVELKEQVSLQIRAANRCRPALHVLDYRTSTGESLHVAMHEGARFTLDGLIVAGRPVQVEGIGEQPAGIRVSIRRCTLVPGWNLDSVSEPKQDEASLELDNVRGRVSIESSILGGIAVMNDTTAAEPIEIALNDSILDATSNDLDAIAGPGGAYAWAALTIVRCTVFGQILAHAIDLAENSLFGATVTIVRRQRGCVRF